MINIWDLAEILEIYYLLDVLINKVIKNKKRTL